MADRYYKVAVNSWEIGEEELHYPNGQEDIKIIPVVGGAGGNAGRILLGAALIGASFLFPGAGMFGHTSVFGSSTTGTLMSGIGTLSSAIGASLVLGGIANMLTPVPDIPEREQDPRLSFNFSGIQNTSRAGVAVPVIYGQVLTGSVVISAGIETAQVEV